MSQGAGDLYKGYYIKTETRPVNPHSSGSRLYEGSATVFPDEGLRDGGVQATSIGEDMVFDNEFEAHRHAERAAKRYIDRLDS